MNDIKNLKEKQINDYISNIDLSEENINIQEIKDGLSVLLGETPGINLEYETETMVLENGEGTKRINKLESISIFYTYDNDDNVLFGTLKYLV